MASYEHRINVHVSASAVWDAIRDVGNLHLRVAPGLVTSVQMDADGSARVVTFGNGMVLREPIISINDAAFRLAWTAQSDQWSHHNASLQVFDCGDGQSETVWIADVLPHDAGPTISMIMEMGLAAMKAHLEQGIGAA